MQNYRSKSETAIIVAGCLKYRRFQFFFAVSVSVFTFWLLDFFAVSSGFFAVSLGFFAISTPANTCKGRQIQNLLTGRKNISPAIIPEKAIILHTLEDVLWQKYHNENGLCLQTQICICSQWLLRRQNPPWIPSDVYWCWCLLRTSYICKILQVPESTATKPTVYLVKTMETSIGWELPCMASLLLS